METEFRIADFELRISIVTSAVSTTPIRNSKSEIRNFFGGAEN
jgi:hypothetical protein